MTSIGSLFSGYGGLDIAAQTVLGGDLLWYSEIDKAACTVMQAHHPTVPNLGDVTKIDWGKVASVDVLTGGYPCQPFSQAGKRKGTDDERHLWPFVCEAIDALRPRIVFLENVRGHLSLGFGDVLSDLSRVGYDAKWGVVRASDAGAPHARARIFIFAYPASERGERSGQTLSTLSGRKLRHGYGRSCDSSIDIASDANDTRQSHRNESRQSQQYSVESNIDIITDANSHDDGTGQRGRLVEINKNEHQDKREWGGSDHIPFRFGGESNENEKSNGETSVDWGQYADAVGRWECLTRPVPNPTITRDDGQRRLNPMFVEWMMGLPAGWVTGNGLRPAQELKMLGNGVVPQQAMLALHLLGVSDET